MKTQMLRDEHVELLALAGKIPPLLETTGTGHGTALRETLVQINARLGLHLALEDKDVYPALAQSNRPEVASVAKRFIEEMGGIGAAFKDYLKKYPNAATIESQWNAFKAETMGVLKVIGSRIEREEKELYPLVDRAG